jgi:Holliday junction resolvase RusA-like endonuclease
MIDGGASEERPTESMASSPAVIHKGWRIPMLPVSMNKLYAINYRTKQVYMTPEARQFKSQAKLFVSPFEIKSSDRLEMKLDVHTDWYFKNGNPKKSDIQNLIKVVVDMLSERLGFDDSQVWIFTANKIQSTENFCWVEITKL